MRGCSSVFGTYRQRNGRFSMIVELAKTSTSSLYVSGGCQCYCWFFCTKGSTTINVQLHMGRSLFEYIHLYARVQ